MSRDSHGTVDGIKGRGYFRPMLSTPVDQLLEEMIQQQQAKTLRLARERIPGMTGDDILNPHDFPELLADPVFNYEDGITAGLMAAQMAIRAQNLKHRG